MGPVAQQLLHRIVEHRLDDRSPYFAHLRRRLERGRPMRDAVARTHLHRVEDTIDQMRACPNRLARAPSEDQLYTRNRPEIEVATLVEAPELRCGFYLDEAMHCVAVGTSGSGKTTFFRTLIREVDHWNTRHSDQPVVVIVLAPKGEDLADIRICTVGTVGRISVSTTTSASGCKTPLASHPPCGSRPWRPPLRPGPG